ncbi:hypothetical protein IAI18_13970 [Acetobacteraceae bacterium H6797]|nr:hypothetical protein [Acetobacteraceae bacterium H6797]
MPSDLSISSVSPVTRRETADTPAPKAEAMPAPPEAPSPTAATPNPRLRIEGDLGMVVIEFRDRYGQVANSIPTQRELASYQVASRSGDAGSLPEGTLPDRDDEEAEKPPINQTQPLFPQPTPALPTVAVPTQPSSQLDESA